MAIMISIPSGIVANQEATQNLTENYSNTIATTEEEINKTATLIECRTSSGRGFTGMPSDMPSGMPFGAPPSGFEQEEVFVNETVVDDIRSIEGVKNIVEFLEKSSEETTTETITGPGGRSFTISRPVYTITGVSLNSSFINNYSILPTEITSGRNLQEGDTRVVLMSSNLTDYYGVGVGDTVDIYGESFTIVGIYDTTDQGIMQTRTAYMNITDAQIITGNAGNVSRLDVYVESSSDVDAIADLIEATYSDFYVTTYNDRLESLERMQEMYETTLENAESTLAQTQTTATQVIIIATAATSLIVLFVMLYTVRERTKEIGTLKAMGFHEWTVLRQFVLEGTLLSLIAGLVGVVIGVLAAPVLSSLLLPSSGLSSVAVNAGAITIDPQLMLIAVGAAVLLGALGSLYPAWRASKIRPAEAMRYE